MKRDIFLIIAAASIILGVAVLSGSKSMSSEFPDPPAQNTMREHGVKTAILAGGCFWGMEGVFEKLNGVRDVVSGYSGGTKETASYYTVGSGKTGHAESIKITYDSSIISFGTLLKVFFSVAHDPTELNYQGPDVGTQYRSAIFYQDEYQKQVAGDYIRILDKAKVFELSIVTEVSPNKGFYPAEAYHQDFMKRNPNYPYIVHWDKPKIADLEKKYPDLLK
ncbi:MAG: peptide-methionine (S)-S-oxide reductase MsrA [Spirochaetales bacterium]|nr:peptide-methionine (S)-S-oxide reductase MsrA [Spirochaetales bacterium]